MRVGLLGGTFDPPHVAHLIVGSDLFAALELDRLLFVPASVPPHKQGSVHASADRRLEMVRAAVEGDSRFAVDDLELRRAGASYTVDTLREIRDRLPDAEIFFAVGVDQLREFHTWREPAEVAALARLTVVSRAGEDPPPESPYPILPVQVTRVDLSATEIRRRVREGLSIRYLVPEAVREIIEREGMYRAK